MTDTNYDIEIGDAADLDEEEPSGSSLAHDPHVASVTRSEVWPVKEGADTMSTGRVVTIEVSYCDAGSGTPANKVVQGWVLRDPPIPSLVIREIEAAVLHAFQVSCEMEPTP